MKFQIRSMVLYPASFKNALGSRQSISGPLRRHHLLVALRLVAFVLTVVRMTPEKDSEMIVREKIVTDSRRRSQNHRSRAATGPPLAALRGGEEGEPCLCKLQAKGCWVSPCFFAIYLGYQCIRRVHFLHNYQYRRSTLRFIIEGGK